jgi:hypothetical protein
VHLLIPLPTSYAMPRNHISQILCYCAANRFAKENFSSIRIYSHALSPRMILASKRKGERYILLLRCRTGLAMNFGYALCNAKLQNCSEHHVLPVFWRFRESHQRTTFFDILLVHFFSSQYPSRCLESIISGHQHETLYCGG